MMAASFTKHLPRSAPARCSSRLQGLLLLALRRGSRSVSGRQIHHSDAPQHFHKNFSTNLSLWDWMFGTLYVTTPVPEPIEFGTAERDSHRYLTLYSLIVMPFVDTALKLVSRRRPFTTPDSAPDA